MPDDSASTSSARAETATARDADPRRGPPLRRFFFLPLGWLCVGLGAIGAFLPLLPTTPFLLAAAFCFDRSSPRFHRWLAGNRLLAPFLEHYRGGGGVPATTRRNAVVFLWTGLILSATLRFHAGYWLALLAVGAAVTWHIAGLKPKARGALPPTEADPAKSETTTGSGTNPPFFVSPD